MQQQQQEERQEQEQQQPAVPSGMSRVGGESDGPGSGRIPPTVEQAAVAEMEAGGEVGGGRKEEPVASQERGAASPPAVTRQKTPPPSPKVWKQYEAAHVSINLHLKRRAGGESAV